MARTSSQTPESTSTTEVIARLLLSDQRLTSDAATRIAEKVETMYQEMLNDRPPLSVRMRSARTFTPAAGALLAQMLTDMQAKLLAE